MYRWRTECDSLESFAKVYLGVLIQLNLVEFGHASVGEIRDYIDEHLGPVKILFVGSNPSRLSPDDFPFDKDTKSYKFIQNNWLKNKDPAMLYITYTNLSHIKTEGNKQLRMKDIDIELVRERVSEQIADGYAVVACGKVASKGLTKAGVEHFEMPHPSGLCRFWNNPEDSKNKIQEMWTWIENKKNC